jgi:two-component system, chemotaxis family, protein-glutamate methylesterase/glutaminase
MANTDRAIRVLVVDDSATVRAVLCRELPADPQIEVIGYARDGLDGVEKVASLQPDVITLDVEMPRLNGLEALERIMRERPLPVVMVSSLTRAGADATLRALELGAVDFVAKPVAGGIASVHGVIEELTVKIKYAATARVRRLVGPAGPRVSAQRPRPAPTPSQGWQQRVVVVGASTGGPQALRTVLTSFPADTAVPILVVQHMPAGFTRAFAERVDEIGPLPMREAKPGSKIEPGVILLAPGGFHMAVRRGGTIELNQAPMECGVRPAVNITMESAAAVYGAQTIGVVLTGMGHDGTRGAGLIRQAGGEVVAEHESTCVVYGMPRSVAEAGFADRVVPLQNIADAVTRMCKTPIRREASA